MKIGIIGGGSIGLLFAYYMNLIYPVTLYVRTTKQKELLDREGFIFTRGAEEHKTVLDVKLFSEWHGAEDITFIAVKQYQLQPMIGQLQKHGRPGHTFVFLQNGMGHIKWLDRLHGDIYLATVEHGALRLDGNRVCHTGIGTTKIAPYGQVESSTLHSFTSQFHETFPFIIEEDYEKMLLKKLVVNAVINPLTAVLRVKNGEIIENPHYFRIARLVFAEIEQSLNLKEGERYFENVCAVCQKTAANQSSMLRDLEEKRQTEIDAILGYILEKADERKIHIPVIQAFYYAVKGKECKVEEK